MKILFLHTDLLQGGSANQIVSLSVQFKKMGHDVTFLTYYNHPNYDFYTDKLRGENVQLFQLNLADRTSNDSSLLQKLLFKVKSLLQIRRFIRKSAFDAVVTFLPEADFINICSVYPFKKWNVICGERVSEPNTPKEILFYRKFYQYADALVTNSHKNWEIINRKKQLVREKKRHVIYNSVDIHYFSPDKNYTYKKDNKLKILILARYSLQKNIDNLIEAVYLLTFYEQKQLEISWYGYIQNNKAQVLYDNAVIKIEAYGLNEIIKLNNFPTNSYESISQTDVVGLFSLYEGLPNAVIEGMSCGKPIIMTNVSDAKYFVNNENGILIEETDAQTISKALSRLLTVPTEKLQSMGKKSREIAEELFNPDNVANQYLKLLKRKEK